MSDVAAIRLLSEFFAGTLPRIQRAVDITLQTSVREFSDVVSSFVAVKEI
jgi:hypothetical protein